MKESIGSYNMKVYVQGCNLQACNIRIETDDGRLLKNIAGTWKELKSKRKLSLTRDGRNLLVTCSYDEAVWYIDNLKIYDHISEDDSKALLKRLEEEQKVMMEKIND